MTWIKSVDINIVQQSCWCPTDIPLAFNVFYTKGSLSTSGTCDLALDFLAGGESLDLAWVGHQHPVLAIWWRMGICGSVQFSSLAQVSSALCDPMDCSTPGFPVHHQLPEFAQTHVHWSVMPSNHLPPSIFPSIRVFSNDSVFHIRWLNIGVSASASVLPTNTKDWFPWGWTDWISLQFKGLSWVFSNTTVQKHQFFGVQLSLWFNPHIHTWLLEKP